MICVQLVITCDHDGCERSTLGHGIARIYDPLIAKITFDDIVVPPLPNGDESGWGQWGGRTLCPEHALKTESGADK